MRIAFAVLTLALLAGVVIGREKPAEALVQEARPQATRSIDLSRLARAEEEALAADPFAQRSFGAPQAAAKAAPARPDAPLLPFRYMGKLSEGDRHEILLLRGDDSFSVVAGDKLGPDYRLDKVTASTLTTSGGSNPKRSISCAKSRGNAAIRRSSSPGEKTRSCS